MKLYHLVPLFTLLAAPSAWAVISLGGSTSDWTAVVYPSTSRSDYEEDQQTGHLASDIVGDIVGNQVGFYKKYDDGGGSATLDDDYIGFRVRMSAQDGNQSASWDANLLVGIDVGGEGAVDVFLIASQKNGGIGFYSVDSTLPGANSSPSTTSVTQIMDATGTPGFDWERSTTATDPLDPDFGMFDYRAVSAATDHHINDGTPGASDDLDGGGDTDFFISFQVDMLTLIEAVRLSNTGAVLDAASGLRFLVGTSIQDNAFNQDLNGQNGNAVNKGGDGDPYSQANSGKTWAQLGAATDTYTASGGSPVPEPATYALLLGFAVLAAATVRRRR